jgi:hypothetical protein
MAVVVTCGECKRPFLEPTLLAHSFACPAMLARELKDAIWNGFEHERLLTLKLDLLPIDDRPRSLSQIIGC